ncbi:Bug family tripartite tricarboxylate transporter substrate binding protein [Roseateles toxinivorans]|uniref:Tripartite-type tricarboxylate transporter receptor subunit TctC n=1 Tax=Roseateles toxinivorans TaxID=270368 RepID=A0A4R6QMJ5_9BURK|nr:tripartite tricarboxylate transporter substrate binding protein [Roseateles toxinivorans]TDP71356.1 tripartite-type tricarboxylate transporter receptor subunit TctC [Roseateles toxinivorans]
MQRRHFLHTAAAGAVALSTPAWAQAWPSRPIKLLVPFPAGSSPDLIARAVAEPLAAALGQPVVVDNRPGAGGNVGTGMVAKAEPDGYTFLFTIQGPLVTAPLLSKQLGYDPIKELAPVTLVATSPNLLVVDPKLGASTLADFVRIAREQKGKLNYGSVGNGSASHLAMELFKTRSGADLLHVPYQGFPQVVNAILAGQVQAGFMVPGIAMGQVRAGKLKALGVTTLGRVGALPEIPTLAEQGFANFEAISWQAVLAPARTPQAIVNRVSAELVRIIKSDEVRTRMLSQYFSAAGTTPDALAALIKSERDSWAKVIKAAGVKPE